MWLYRVDRGIKRPAMNLDQKIAELEARPARYTGEAGRRRLATLESAIGICVIDTNLIRTPILDRLVKLLASGRITERKYRSLVRTLCFPAEQEQSSSDQVEAEHQLAVGLAGMEIYRNALAALAKR